DAEGARRPVCDQWASWSRAVGRPAVAPSNAGRVIPRRSQRVAISDGTNRAIERHVLPRSDRDSASLIDGVRLAQVPGVCSEHFSGPGAACPSADQQVLTQGCERQGPETPAAGRGGGAEGSPIRPIPGPCVAEQGGRVGAAE